MLLFAAALMFSSCGIAAYQASSSDGQRFQDGIYSNTPSFRSKTEKEESQAEVKALANEHLLIRGFVSDEELAQFYSNCRISLVALRYGAGIKGKVIEAMKFGTPVVTTSSGAEGIVNAEDVMVVEDDAKVLAERLAALYENENELEKMSRDSVAYIQREFSPANAIKVIGSEFDL